MSSYSLPPQDRGAPAMPAFSVTNDAKRAEKRKPVARANVEYGARQNSPVRDQQFVALLQGQKKRA
jgi:hypothetical protein